MKRVIACAAIVAAIWAVPAAAADKLIVSSWGGSWKDLISETVAKKFTADTGVEVEFVTGGKRKGYAKTNRAEYFAELTEA